MPNVFLAGHDLVQWDLEVVAVDGPYNLRLTIRHPRGAIVEYFSSTQAALVRERELENLLIAARGTGCSATPSLTL